MLRGSWASRSRSTRLEPMKPAEPVMRRVWVLCDILVFDGQKLLGDGVEPCAEGGGEDDAFHESIL